MAVDHLTMNRAMSALYHDLQKYEFYQEIADDPMSEDVHRENCKREAVEAEIRCKSTMEYIVHRFKQDIESMPNSLKDIWYGK